MRIENYLGFPSGISGDELASLTARKPAAWVLRSWSRSVAALDPLSHGLTLDGGEVVAARSLILATGVAWRRLDLEGFDRLIGKGI